MGATHRTGLSSHLAIAKRLVDLGYEVLEPFDTSLPFDLAYVTRSNNGWFRSSSPILVRVQCKTGRYLEQGGVIVANGYTNDRTKDGYKRHGFWGEAEYFGIYCAELDKTYFVPVMKFRDGKLPARVGADLSRNPIYLSLLPA